MTENYQLYHLMQLAGGTFPAGGFSQSWGLETYVTAGKIKSAEAFTAFVESYLTSTIARCEGPILYEAWKLSKRWDPEKIARLEELSCACKVTRESRESSLRMGKAFLRIAAEIADDERVAELRDRYRGRGMTYPVIFGLVCGALGIDPAETMRAFVFSTVNGLVQSGVKLIPLGNTEAQRILRQLQQSMERCTMESMEWPVERISNFCPGLDIAGILHESLPVRLYMS